MIICALFYRLSVDTETVYFGTIELNVFDQIFIDLHTLRNPDEREEKAKNAVETEFRLSGLIMGQLAKLPPDDPLRNEIWQRLELDDYYDYRDELSPIRLATIYTPETVKIVEPMLVELRIRHGNKNWRLFKKSRTLRDIMIFLLGGLLVSIGAALVRLETLRRKTTCGCAH